MIKINQEVLILTGSEKGKVAKIKFIKGQYVYLEQCGLKKRSVKGKGFLSVESKIHLSNIKAKTPKTPNT